MISKPATQRSTAPPSTTAGNRSAGFSITNCPRMAIQAEMGTRGRLEEARRALLHEAGARLGQDGATVTLGSVEEWTIANTSLMDHPFHLHVWPMQVVAAADMDPSGHPDWRDVVIVPARGQVTVRIRFAAIAGRTVYHCHVLDHEDHGMMGIIDAAPRSHPTAMSVTL